MQLLLDSSGGWLVVALVDEGAVLVERALPAASTEAREVGGVVRSLLGEGGVRPSAIDMIGVGSGPGSFIGTRVAISFANGFAAATGCLVHPLPTLAAYAAGSGGHCIVLRDARRGEAYVHDSRADLAHVTLVPLAELGARLQETAAAVIVAEAPLAEDKHGERWHETVTTAAAGRVLRWLDHVPAAGLLALLPQVEPAVYAEPLYSRGFL